MKEKEVEVDWISKSKSISQVYSSGMEYALLTDNFEMIHQPVYCKDFMQDAIAGFLHKKTMSIYGFSYNPKTNKPLCMKKTRLLIVNASDAEMQSKRKASKDFLNQIEKKLKMARTQIYKVKNPSNSYSKCGGLVYDGSSRWMFAPPMISLYTLLIRVSMVHTKGKDFMETINNLCNGSITGYQTSDKSQMSGAKKALSWILEKGDRNLFLKKRLDNYNQDSVSVMHNTLGIVSYANGNSKGYFPYWYEKV